MVDHPKIIERRHFTCKDCGYFVQLNGEMYFDYGCYNYIATFPCKQCLTLYESVISEMEVWDMEKRVTYNLAEEPPCLNCSAN
jgi:hypothetical protein